MQWLDQTLVWSVVMKETCGWKAAAATQQASLIFKWISFSCAVLSVSPHQMAASAVNLLHFSLSKAIPVPSPRFARRPFRQSSSSISPFAAATDLFDRAEQGIVDPGLRPSEVIFSNPGYHAQIVVDEAESEEALVRRFRREVSKAGVIQEYKRRRFFENKQEEKKRKAREAGRRNRRRRSGARFPSPFSADDVLVPQPARDDDNWDLPEGDIPY